ncbi:hypothetical protein, unlikely [Trypanosoma brucei gambiense DAL972]|uniref:Uncharacterized protein n=1 Tax=Trypanosoma brucei gambiense (strain MHOM/CI/86/DAL972) TaxID=679716 RepID=C9ZNC2_TRYB9|nr:hypothetical protein, unlikely [Trypanosoma brucei gambiense DAL972]CBH10900.1 hypothetical protein, unlikely [Trypanosoma brucei gambiense DAL972]|eukprot:XP_011773187.1 hypothetical protein, unlikely [Trypanosoma brucei gambiense DAL972]
MDQLIEFWETHTTIAPSPPHIYRVCMWFAVPSCSEHTAFSFVSHARRKFTHNSVTIFKLGCLAPPPLFPHHRDPSSSFLCSSEVAIDDDSKDTRVPYRISRSPPPELFSKEPFPDVILFCS